MLFFEHYCVCKLVGEEEGEGSDRGGGRGKKRALNDGLDSLFVASRFVLWIFKQKNSSLKRAFSFDCWS